MRGSQNTSDAVALPQYILDLLSDLPANVDRRTGADLITQHLFPVSYRSLEAWPLPLVAGSSVATVVNDRLTMVKLSCCCSCWNNFRPPLLVVSPAAGARLDGIQNGSHFVVVELERQAEQNISPRHPTGGQRRSCGLRPVRFPAPALLRVPGGSAKAFHSAGSAAPSLPRSSEGSRAFAPSPER
jgi:hypothetical protein